MTIKRSNKSRSPCGSRNPEDVTLHSHRHTPSDWQSFADNSGYRAVTLLNWCWKLNGASWRHNPCHIAASWLPMRLNIDRRYPTEILHAALRVIMASTDYWLAGYFFVVSGRIFSILRILEWWWWLSYKLTQDATPLPGCYLQTSRQGSLTRLRTQHRKNLIAVKGPMKKSPRKE